MSKWKDAFLRSLNPNEDTDRYIFGPPATPAEITAVEKALGAKLPDELRDLLQEFNGVNDGGTYYFSTQKMPTAIESYRDWDWPTEKLLEWSQNIAYVLQENGNATMCGVVIKPFGPFRYGQVVGFDHDLIMDGKEPEELFGSRYGSLLELVEAEYKNVEP